MWKERSAALRMVVSVTKAAAQDAQGRLFIYSRDFTVTVTVSHHTYQDELAGKLRTFGASSPLATTITL